MINENGFEMRNRETMKEDSTNAGVPDGPEGLKVD
jgi:hypothetical protein